MFNNVKRSRILQKNSEIGVLVIAESLDKIKKDFQYPNCLT